MARRDDGEGPDPETKVQVKFQNLSWEQALYNDCLDFSDVVEDVRSDIYHEKLDGHFLVGYVFSDPVLVTAECLLAAQRRDFA